MTIAAAHFAILTRCIEAFARWERRRRRRRHWFWSRCWGGLWSRSGWGRLTLNFDICTAGEDAAFTGSQRHVRITSIPAPIECATLTRHVRDNEGICPLGKPTTRTKWNSDPLLALYGFQHMFAEALLGVRPIWTKAILILATVVCLHIPSDCDRFAWFPGCLNWPWSCKFLQHRCVNLATGLWCSTDGRAHFGNTWVHSCNIVREYWCWKTTGWHLRTSFQIADAIEVRIRLGVCQITTRVCFVADNGLARCWVFDESMPRNSCYQTHKLHHDEESKLQQC